MIQSDTFGGFWQSYEMEFGVH